MLPTPPESTRRDAVIGLVLQCIKSNIVIKLPEFNRHAVGRESSFALAALGESASPYTGTYGPFRYHFEGEEDLLHLFVIRQDSGSLTVEEAQEVVAFLLDPLPRALIWLRPGNFSQHFYIGHDELLKYLEGPDPVPLDQKIVSN